MLMRLKLKKISNVAFLQDRSAATSIEYALIATGVAVAIAATVYLLGDSMLAMYQSISDSFTS